MQQLPADLASFLWPLVMGSSPIGAVTTASLAIAAATVSAFGIYLLIKLAGLTFGLIEGMIEATVTLLSRCLTFLIKEIRSSLDVAGSLLACLVLLPMIALAVLFRRREARTRQGQALRSEAGNALGGLYFLLVGNLAWLLGLRRLTAGLERTIKVIAPDSHHAGPQPSLADLAHAQEEPEFEGYRIVKEFEPGGSGARVFLVDPHPVKGSSRPPAPGGRPGQVVIKSFDLGSGSTVPQIVRESRSLAAARSLGLVLHHHLDERTFWYAMPYVPGESLDAFTSRMHGRAGENGLSAQDLRRVVQYASDLLGHLRKFHGAGLWHKDIKPGNLIVNRSGAQLVDLGLVTPLTSAMTLTTHGTEYFRDPELVRMAIRGAQVREVDGVKFDLYSSGAVLYSMLEGSFPAHGSLSRLTASCPDGLAFIVRRAMADLSKRYASADEMLGDLEHMASATDMWDVRPADLPSLSGNTLPADPVPTPQTSTRASEPRTWEAGGSPGPPPHQHLFPKVDRRRRAGLSPLARASLIGACIMAIAYSLARTGSPPYGHGYRVGESPAREYMQADGSRATPWSEPLGSNTRARSSQASTTEGPHIGAPGLDPSISPNTGAGSPQTLLGPELLRDLPRGSQFLVLGSPGVDLTNPRILELKEGLRGLGHRIAGEGTDAQSIELTASATATLASAEAFDQQARERLRLYLEEQQDLDAVIWLGQRGRDRVVLTLVTAQEAGH